MPECAIVCYHRLVRDAPSSVGGGAAIGITTSLSARATNTTTASTTSTASTTTTTVTTVCAGFGAEAVAVVGAPADVDGSPIARLLVGDAND